MSVSPAPIFYYVGVETVKSGMKYFLGSNTNEGFYSLFDELYSPEEDFFVYIVKGGPGCGKSTLMGRVADEMEGRGYTVVRVMCASDPSSHDAIICPEKKFAMVDGTAPHVIEPKYYGAVEEIVNLGEALDTKVLRSAAGEIRSLCTANSQCYKKSANYMKAAASLLRNSKRFQDEYIDYEKLYNYVIRFAKRNLSGAEGDGRVEYRFFTAVTNVGEVTFVDGMLPHYDKIICIDDPIGSVGGQILDCLLSVALDCGMNAVAGVSPYDTEELLQLFFPDKRIALVRGDAFPATATIHASRFIRGDGLKAHKNRITFNKRAAKELTAAAVASLADAKALHDELERIYKSAIDYNVLGLKADATVDKILESI